MDADGFFVHEAVVFAAVEVGEVHWISGELDAAIDGFFAFRQVGIVVTFVSRHVSLRLVSRPASPCPV